MDTNNQADLSQLPSNWWRYLHASQLLVEWFKQHLLALLITVKFGESVRHAIYSGFLLYHREHLLWVTSGHVIDELDNIIADDSLQVLRMRWLDNCDIPGAEALPVHNPHLETFSTNSSGIDFGVAKITGLDAENIIRSGRIKVMTEQAWRNLNLAKPGGYYVLGYPQQWVDVEEADTAQESAAVSIRLSCLPLQRIERQESEDEFWSDPVGFYGQILPFADRSGAQPTDIRGMSGGPVISLERDPSNRIRYRLFGVQRSTNGRSIIRAEPIETIAAIIGP